MAPGGGPDAKARECEVSVVLVAWRGVACRVTQTHTIPYHTHTQGRVTRGFVVEPECKVTCDLQPVCDLRSAGQSLLRLGTFACVRVCVLVFLRVRTEPKPISYHTIPIHRAAGNKRLVVASEWRPACYLRPACVDLRQPFFFH